MGLFDLFKSSKPSKKSIAKQVIKAKDIYSQSDYRKMAMEKLLSFNCKEALDGLLQRFSVVAQSPHWDEEEKRWLVDALASKGQMAKNSLCEYIEKSNEVSYATKALAKLCDDKDQLIDIMIKALNKRSIDDHRSMQGKRELIGALGEYGGDKIIHAILPYVDDHSDEVQITTIDLLKTKNSTDSHNKLLEVITDSSRSARVLRHGADAVSHLKIKLNNAKVSSEILNDYRVKNNKLMHK